MKPPRRYRSVVLRTAADDFARDVRRSLGTSSKWLPCKYLYDAAGLALFERICELPEYYLTRVESSILHGQGREIVELCPAELTLVELGPGSSKKTRKIIEPCLARQRDLAYFAIDISPDGLQAGAQQLLEEYPALSICCLVGEFADGLRYLAERPGGPRLVAFLGSTVGNFDELEIAEFLGMLHRELRPADRFLLGVDLIKDPALLEAAYDDSEGVTAKFNRNILARINRELSADFDLSSFRHRAVFKRERSRIEMHLVSRRDQRVRIGDLDLEIPFPAGSTIHTENCYKHSLVGMTALLTGHGFQVLRTFTDSAGQYCLFLVSACSN